MKKLLFVGVLLLGSTAFSAPAKAPVAKMSLADARAQIGKCISDPALMTKTMKALSPEDQKALIASVNEAIIGMPNSNEQKSATFLNVNHAALKGAAKGNLKALIAEVFATVPPEVLTIINERFAEDLFSRTADPSRTFSDAQFEQISKDVMKTVNERMATLDNGPARSAFVILMLVRASGGTPESLQETLISTLPADAQNAARNDWIPSALGQKNKIQSYEPILGGADALNALPENRVVIRLAGPQLLESMLGDIIEGTPLINNSMKPEIYIRPLTGADMSEAGIIPNVVEEFVEAMGYQNQSSNSLAR